MMILILTIVSSIIGIYSLFFSYRKIVGARRERTKSAYNEIVKMLLRTLVTANHLPGVEEISRIIKAKSIEKGIMPASLPDEETMIHSLYARIVEDEILDGTRKKELIDKINDYLEKIRKDEPEESEEVIGRQEKILKENFVKFYLAVISLGVSIVSIFLIVNILERFTPFVFDVNIFWFLVPIIVTILILYLILEFIRHRERQGISEASVGRKILSYKEFEDKIYRIISKLGTVSRHFSLSTDDVTIAFDFSLKRKGKTYLIEVKANKGFFNRRIVTILAKNSRIARKIEKDAVLILVVRYKKFLGADLYKLKKTWNFIFTEYEMLAFRNRLIHNATRQ